MLPPDRPTHCPPAGEQATNFRSETPASIASQRGLRRRQQLLLEGEQAASKSNSCEPGLGLGGAGRGPCTAHSGQLVRRA